MLEEAAGAGVPLFPPRLVFFRSHTAPAPVAHVAAGGDAWDTVKPLGQYFPNLRRVILVDDDHWKVQPPLPHLPLPPLPLSPSFPAYFSDLTLHPVHRVL